MELTNEELKMLARRCRLNLHEDELEKYRRDLFALEQLASALLPYDGVGTDVLPSCSLSQMRQDVALPFKERERLLSEAPVREGAYLSVPCTVEGVS